MEPQCGEGDPALSGVEVDGRVPVVSGRDGMTTSFHWLDVQRIGEELEAAHPEVDPLTISFPRLKALVAALAGFSEEPGHPCNERILEAIQQAWIDERGG